MRVIDDTLYRYHMATLETHGASHTRIRSLYARIPGKYLPRNTPSLSNFARRYYYMRILGTNTYHTRPPSFPFAVTCPPLAVSAGVSGCDSEGGVGDECILSSTSTPITCEFGYAPAVSATYTCTLNEGGNAAAWTGTPPSGACVGMCLYTRGWVG